MTIVLLGRRVYRWADNREDDNDRLFIKGVVWILGGLAVLASSMAMFDAFVDLYKLYADPNAMVLAAILRAMNAK